MSSAISFGVFCRLAPSTSAIMRSRNVSPGLAEIAHDQPVREQSRAAGDAAAVAAAFADHRCAFAGDGALVHRRHAFDHFAVSRDQVAGLDQDDIVLAQRARPAPVWRVERSAGSSSFLASTSRASLAAANRPAPCRGPRPSPRQSWQTARVNHSQAEMPNTNPADSGPPAKQGSKPEARGEQAANEHREHHRIAELRRGSSLRNESIKRLPHDGRVKQSGWDFRCSSSSTLVLPCDSVRDHLQMFDDRSQGQRRNKRQRTDEQHGARPAEPRTAACAWAECRHPAACISSARAIPRSPASESISQ